jgi:hypothetical protein
MENDMKKTIARLICALVIFAAGFWSGREATVKAQSQRIFELRTYTTLDGKLDALHARFRQHTTRIFEKHGMTNIGYFRPMDPPLRDNTLVYLLAFPSRDAAKRSWDAFRTDPEWMRAREESERGGKIVAKVESVFLEPADYSRLK